jgi:hypothetical protein
MNEDVPSVAPEPGLASQSGPKKHTKKIIVICITVFILVCAVVFAYLRTPAQPSAPMPASPSHNALPMHIVPVKHAGLPNWTLKKQPAFTVSYPPNWSLQSSAVAGGGYVSIIRPPQGAYPQIVIEQDPFSNSLIEQKTAILNSLGLKKTTIALGPATAEKFSGTVSSRILTGQADIPMQETSIIETKGPTVICFEYAYYGAKQDPNLEEYFSEIISSVSTK